MMSPAPPKHLYIKGHAGKFTGGERKRKGLARATGQSDGVRRVCPFLAGPRRPGNTPRKKCLDKTRSQVVRQFLKRRKNGATRC